MINQKMYFDNQAEKWHHKIDEKTKLRLRSIFKEKIPVLKAPVLDIGSGTGVLLPELYSGLDKSFPVYEADFSWNMLMQNRSNNNSYPSIHYVQTDSHELPFKNNFFNSIICFAAFAHFIDKPRVAQEFHRVLSPGGKLTILHLMCHIKLNKMHLHVGGAVKNDILPAVRDLSRILSESAFSVLAFEENKSIYLITAEK